MYSINKEKFLTAQETLEISQLLKTDRSRDALMIEITLYTGARSQEVLNLRVKDVDLLRGVVLIRGVKNSNDRELPLPKHLMIKLKAFLGELKSDNEQFLFPITTRRFRQIWSSRKLTDKSIKSLRHGFAMAIFAKTKDIRLVQVVLGHRNIQNTLVYADYHYKTEELKKLLNFSWEAYGQ